MAEVKPQQAVTDSDGGEVRSVERRIGEVRSEIRDIGGEIDTQKTMVAAAMGGGVFLALLALLAAYDLFTGKADVWRSVGVTRELLRWLAIGMGLAALLCVRKGASLLRRRDPSRAARIEELQRELEWLLARKDFLQSE
jgi:hypothetical protein